MHAPLRSPFEETPLHSCLTRRSAFDTFASGGEGSLDVLHTSSTAPQPLRDTRAYADLAHHSCRRRRSFRSGAVCCRWSGSARSCAGARIVLCHAAFDSALSGRPFFDSKRLATSRGWFVHDQIRALDRQTARLRSRGLNAHASVVWDEPAHEAIIRAALREKAARPLLVTHPESSRHPTGVVLAARATLDEAIAIHGAALASTLQVNCASSASSHAICCRSSRTIFIWNWVDVAERASCSRATPTRVTRAAERS